MLLELTEFRLQRILARGQLPPLLAPGLGIGAHAANALSNVALLARQLLGLALRILHVALRARGAVALETTLDITQALKRSGRLRRCTGIAAGRGAAHRVGRIAHPPGRFF